MKLYNLGGGPYKDLLLVESVLNVKAGVGAFNQEKALVGAFSVIVKTDCGTDGSFYSTNLIPPASPPLFTRISEYVD